MALKVLVTGACGFVGSHIVEELLETPETQVIALDCLTYAGRLDRLEHLDRSRIKFVNYDFSQPLTDALLHYIGPVNSIIHNGSETHVARSFLYPEKFVQSNIFGTLYMLEAARRMNISKFIYVSTDEVFGPSSDRAFRESDPLLPTNPYAATKAAGEHLVYSYFRSFGLPAVVTRTMNMFGERQHAEKFVPMTVQNILQGNYVDIHVSPSGEMGTRHWLYAGEQAKALRVLLDHGMPGESYNISAGTVATNLSIANRIARILNKPLNYRKVVSSAPSHDLHYSIDDSKMRRIFPALFDFDSLFERTVLWYKYHPQYLED